MSARLRDVRCASHCETCLSFHHCAASTALCLSFHARSWWLVAASPTTPVARSSPSHHRVDDVAQAEQQGTGLGVRRVGTGAVGGAAVRAVGEQGGRGVLVLHARLQHLLSQPPPRHVSAPGTQFPGADIECDHGARGLLQPGNKRGDECLRAAGQQRPRSAARRGRAASSAREHV